MFFGLPLPQAIAISILPLLFAITVHEVAHGWVAYKLGDKTAKMMGRLTLNPVKHIDPIGTILIPALTAYFIGLPFGWAKPVPVTIENLRQPRRDMALVALAGPGANLLMAIIWALIAKIGMSINIEWLSTPLVLMGVIGITFNLILMVLNLLPILPLDGGRVVESALPGPLSYKFSRLEPYGFLVLLALLVSGLLPQLLGPPIHFLEEIIFQIFGL